MEQVCEIYGIVLHVYSLGYYMYMHVVVVQSETSSASHAPSSGMIYRRTKL